MRQNLFSMWVSTRFRMETTERQIPGTLRGTSHGGQGPHFPKCQAHSVPPGCEDTEPRNWVRVGWGWEEDRVLPGSCPDHVSDFHRKKEQLGYIVI